MVSWPFSFVNGMFRRIVRIEVVEVPSKVAQLTTEVGSLFQSLTVVGKNESVQAVTFHLAVWYFCPFPLVCLVALVLITAVYSNQSIRYFVQHGHTCNSTSGTQRLPSKISHKLGYSPG